MSFFSLIYAVQEQSNDFCTKGRRSGAAISWILPSFFFANTQTKPVNCILVWFLLAQIVRIWSPKTLAIVDPYQDRRYNMGCCSHFPLVPIQVVIPIVITFFPSAIFRVFSCSLVPMIVACSVIGHGESWNVSQAPTDVRRVVVDVLFEGLIKMFAETHCFVERMYVEHDWVFFYWTYC